MSTLTHDANAALTNIIKQLDSETRPDQWSLGYARGQIAIVGAYMDPDAQLLEQAKCAVDRLKARQAGAD